MLTKVETSLRVKPRDAQHQTLQVTSAEVAQVLPHVNFQVNVEFDPRTTCSNAPGFAARFVPQTASRLAIRTTPGTVPGTVPTVVPGRSILVNSAVTKARLRCYLAGFGLIQRC